MYEKYEHIKEESDGDEEIGETIVEPNGFSILKCEFIGKTEGGLKAHITVKHNRVKSKSSRVENKKNKSKNYQEAERPRGALVIHFCMLSMCCLRLQTVTYYVSHLVHFVKYLKLDKYILSILIIQMTHEKKRSVKTFLRDSLFLIKAIPEESSMSNPVFWVVQAKFSIV